MGIGIILIIFTVKASRPNIIFFLVDDVGLNDFSYSSHSYDIEVDINTPNIDFLANHGIKLNSYYAYSYCTPSRAALLTGRYPYQVGLTSVLVPGTPAGLNNVLTIPNILRSFNYSTAMTGKWHLGHAKASMTPTGNGFDSFTGMHMWDVDNYSKQMFINPFEPALMIDWVREFSNGSFYHYAESKHSTLAINDDSIAIIENHYNKYKASSIKDPLFLFVAYTAAHSPLQALPQHLVTCQNIKHLWRKLYCGMVMGLDESILNITNTAYNLLGSNTIIIVSSDNGASPWFGGRSYPYRGTKATPFEGGVKVPAFIIELSSLKAKSNKAYSNDEIITNKFIASDVFESKFVDLLRSKQSSNSKFLQNYIFNRSYDSLFHITDWLPTIISICGIKASRIDINDIGIAQNQVDNNSPLLKIDSIDGIDLSYSLPLIFERYMNVDSLISISNSYKESQNSSETLNRMNSDRLVKLRKCADETVILNKRTEVLLEFYFKEDSLYRQDLFAYRVNDMKLIIGKIRDGNWYYPSSTDSINSSSVTGDIWKQSMYSDDIFYQENSYANKNTSIFDLMKYVQYHKSYVVHYYYYAVLYFITKASEGIMRSLTYLFDDVGKFDNIDMIIIMSIVHDMYSDLIRSNPIPSNWHKYLKYDVANLSSSDSTCLLESNLDKIENQVCNIGKQSILNTENIWLFNLTSDPYEKVNLAYVFPDIVNDIKLKIDKIKAKKPKQQKYWYMHPSWNDTHVSGNCSMNPSLKSSECFFTHTWIPEDHDPWNDDLIDFRQFASKQLFSIKIALFVLLLVQFAVIYIFFSCVYKLLEVFRRLTL